MESRDGPSTRRTMPNYAHDARMFGATQIELWDSEPPEAEPESIRGATRNSRLLRPGLPTKIIPTKIRWLKTSRIFPMSMRIPPLKLTILPESNPLKSRILVRRLAVSFCRGATLVELVGARARVRVVQKPETAQCELWHSHPYPRQTQFVNQDARNERAQYEVCRPMFGVGMAMNVADQTCKDRSLGR